MSFREVDEARKTAAALSNSGKRGRKRKNSSISQTEDEEDDSKASSSDRRTGRWTTEEISYCDELIAKFKDGKLPLVQGTKLNDFLANMLKSKQSRLTKKMKNAKLSSQTYKCTSGFVMDPSERQQFSRLEESFFHSILCQQERAEIKFHMQIEWREHFSSFSVALGQPLDADAWLSSVEEMDRRENLAKDAARMAKRRVMMGHALSQDSKNLEPGVFIDRTEEEKMIAHGKHDSQFNESLSGDSTNALNLLSDEDAVRMSAAQCSSEMNGKSSLLHAAPFLMKVVAYMERHSVPFEHVDAWVPSFVSGPEGEGDLKCRLCYAGSATTKAQISTDGKGPPQPLSKEDRFNLMAFGDYSQKFSFDVGYGLPGRVYQSGVPTWEQSVHNAPHQHFERCGGAVQWGIKTVVGIPVPSPNVGRIVVTLYSLHDRIKDPDLVARLCDEFSKHMPSPKWKLVVDISFPAIPSIQNDQIHSTPVIEDTASSVSDPPMSKEDGKDNLVDQVISLLGEHMPSDPSSPLASYLPGFMSLRLMLIRTSRSEEEEEFVRTMMGSYSSYMASGRNKTDIAIMMARDFMFIIQSRLSPSFPVKCNPPPTATPAPTNVHFYGTPPADFVYKNSPALTPIIPSSNRLNNDAVSIVSN